MTKLLTFVETILIAVNDKATVLLAAAPAHVGSIALQNNIQGLLP